MKKVHLQYVGEHDAIEAKDLRPGMITVWNGGMKDVVKSVEFSKTGKTVTVTFTVEDEGTRKFRATRLVAVEIAPETETTGATQEAAGEPEATQEQTEEAKARELHVRARELRERAEGLCEERKLHENFVRSVQKVELQAYKAAAHESAVRLASKNPRVAAAMERLRAKQTANDEPEQAAGQPAPQEATTSEGDMGEIMTAAKSRKAKPPKQYTIRVTRDHGKPYEIAGTLEELIQAFSYTLEKGKSWEWERGRRKINLAPKTARSLVNNLQNASDNATVNGYSGVCYELVTV